MAGGCCCFAMAEGRSETIAKSVPLLSALEPMPPRYRPVEGQLSPFIEHNNVSIGHLVKGGFTLKMLGGEGFCIH